MVRVNYQEWPLEIKARPVEKFTDDWGTPPTALLPTSRKEREKWGTHFVVSAIVPTKPVILPAEIWATRPPGLTCGRG
jgi:hypothetical protein